MSSDHPDRRIDPVIAAEDDVAANPGDVALRGHLGWLLLERGEAARAELVFRDAWAIAPDNRQIGHLLSHVLVRLGRHEEGVAAFETAGFDADDYHAQVHYGYLLGGMSAHARAAAAFERALQIKGGEAPVHDALARMQEHQGRLTDALASIELALSLDPNHPGGATYREALLSRLADAEAAAADNAPASGAGQQGEDKPSADEPVPQISRPGPAIPTTLKQRASTAAARPKEKSWLSFMGFGAWLLLLGHCGWISFVVI